MQEPFDLRGLVTVWFCSFPDKKSNSVSKCPQLGHHSAMHYHVSLPLPTLHVPPTRISLSIHYILLLGGYVLLHSISLCLDQIWVIEMIFYFYAILYFVFVMVLKDCTYSRIKYNLDRSTTHPKLDPAWVQTHNLQIMAVHFMLLPRLL